MNLDLKCLYDNEILEKYTSYNSLLENLKKSNTDTAISLFLISDNILKETKLEY